jgi:hypothetical protein
MIQEYLKVITAISIFNLPIIANNTSPPALLA